MLSACKRYVVALGRGWPRASLLAAVGAALVVALVPAPGAGAATGSPGTKTVWLCLPGQKNDPCAPSLSTEVASATSQKLGIKHLRPAGDPKIDCFYVYPTVSDQKTPLSDLTIDPRSGRSPSPGVLLLAVLPGLRTDVPAAHPLRHHGGTSVRPPNLALPYDDVLNAWHTYLKKYNHGRGVVLHRPLAGLGCSSG